MSRPFEDSLARRRRSVWEAADAGLPLWRENLVFFLPFFAVPLWLCAFGLCLLPESLRPASWLILWFLKPLFDRPLLHVIAVRFFEPGAGTGRLCRGLWTSIRRGLVGDLLWRRFSPLRAAVMPLRVLENLPRRRIGERRTALQGGGLGFCAIVTLWGMALEAALLGGEALFCVIMAELLGLDFFSSLGGLMHTGVIVLFAAWCANLMLVESLYVCMGFGLYLNSRVEAEGWDIEIAFRGFAEQYKRKNVTRKNTISVALLCCVLVGLAFPARELAAGEMPANGGTLFDNGAPLETLQAVLESPDFGGERDGWGIRWKNPRQPRESSGIAIAPWLEPVRRFCALALRLLVIALAVALVVFVLVQFRAQGYTRTQADAHRAVRGVRNTSPEHPASLLAKARNAFARGELRRAWGLCAAAAIGSWPAYRGLCFPPDATEYGCVDLVRSSGAGREEELRAFAALVEHWVSCAYGGRLPPAGSFEAAVAFCEKLASRESAEADNA